MNGYRSLPGLAATDYIKHTARIKVKKWSSNSHWPCPLMSKELGESTWVFEGRHHESCCLTLMVWCHVENALQEVHDLGNKTLGQWHILRKEIWYASIIIARMRIVSLADTEYKILSINVNSSLFFDRKHIKVSIQSTPSNRLWWKALYNHRFIIIIIKKLDLINA